MATKKPKRINNATTEVLLNMLVDKPSPSSIALLTLSTQLLRMNKERWDQATWDLEMAKMPWHVLPPQTVAILAIATGNPLAIANVPVPWATMTTPSAHVFPSLMRHASLLAHPFENDSHFLVDGAITTTQMFYSAGWFDGVLVESSHAARVKKINHWVEVLFTTLVDNNLLNGNTPVTTHAWGDPPRSVKMFDVMLSHANSSHAPGMWNALAKSTTWTTPQERAQTVYAWCRMMDNHARSEKRHWPKEALAEHIHQTLLTLSTHPIDWGHPHGLHSTAPPQVTNQASQVSTAGLLIHSALKALSYPLWGKALTVHHLDNIDPALPPLVQQALEWWTGHPDQACQDMDVLLTSDPAPWRVSINIVDKMFTLPDPNLAPIINHALVTMVDHHHQALLKKPASLSAEIQQWQDIGKLLAKAYHQTSLMHPQMIDVIQDVIKIGVEEWLGNKASFHSGMFGTQAQALKKMKRALESGFYPIIMDANHPDHNLLALCQNVWECVDQCSTGQHPPTSQQRAQIDNALLNLQLYRAHKKAPKPSTKKM